MKRLISSFYLGKIKYSKALSLQRDLVKWNKAQPDTANPVLLLLQHYPVYTVGLRSHLYTAEEQTFLESLGADFVKTDRGGLITFHGPGQLVAYPVFSRLHFPIMVKSYVWKLEQVIINLCKKYGITATRSPHTGVWVGDNKICAMGINARQKMYSHGLALNCNTDMLWFSRIVPCGIKDKGVTSLSMQTGRDVSVEEVIPSFVEEMRTVFEWDITEPRDVDVDEDVADDKLFEILTDSNVSLVKGCKS